MILRFEALFSSPVVDSDDVWSAGMGLPRPIGWSRDQFSRWLGIETNSAWRSSTNTFAVTNLLHKVGHSGPGLLFPHSDTIFCIVHGGILWLPFTKTDQWITSPSLPGRTSPEEIHLSL